MRVTFSTIQQGLDAITTAAEQLQHAQQQVSTGKRITAPSDDPAGAQASINLRSDMAGLDAYAKAANTADARLTALDTTLGDIVDKLTQAIATATGARGTEVDQVSRDAASSALAGIRDAIAANINSTFDGVHLFGGTKSDLTPYESSSGTWTYNGNGTPMSVEIAPGRTVSFTMDGSAVLQGADAADVLTVLDKLVADVKTAGNSDAVGAGLTALQSAFSRVTRAQSQVGTDENAVSDAKARLASLRLANVSRLSATEDANMAESIMRMSQADTAYKAALGAVSTAEKLSLLDYLR
jgi:flagellar hook-associated protein 3 FlgL